VVALEKQGKAGDMILVRVRQDQPSMRRSHGGMRRSSATSKRSGSGPPSISSRPPLRALDEDRIALSDIEDRHAR
jgi:hypothetical protein